MSLQTQLIQPVVAITNQGKKKKPYFQAELFCFVCQVAKFVALFR